MSAPGPGQQDFGMRPGAGFTDDADAAIQLLDPLKHTGHAPLPGLSGVAGGDEADAIIAQAARMAAA